MAMLYKTYFNWYKSNFTTTELNHPDILFCMCPKRVSGVRGEEYLNLIFKMKMHFYLPVLNLHPWPLRKIHSLLHMLLKSVYLAVLFCLQPGFTFFPNQQPCVSSLGDKGRVFIFFPIGWFPRKGAHSITLALGMLRIFPHILTLPQFSYNFVVLAYLDRFSNLSCFYLSRVENV